MRLLLLSVLLSGCSLVKLSEDIVLEQCTEHSDCAGLNDPEAEGYPCEQWQCNVDDGRCELRDTDMDDDGQSPSLIVIEDESFECDVAADVRDCDDGNGLRSAGAVELCDGTDNDCDERVDEGALQERQPRRVVRFEDVEGADAVAYAHDASSQTLAIGHALAAEAPGLSVVPVMGEGGAGATTLQVAGPAALSATQVSVAAMEGDRVALAFVNETGPRGLIAGVVTPGAAGELKVSSAAAMQALACGSAEQCARVTLAPALAADGDDVLLASLRAGDDLPECGAPGGAEAPELQLSALVLRGGDQLDERDDNPLSLGPTVDGAGAGAAVLALAELPGGPGAGLGFLVAHVDDAGDLRVQRVEIVAGRAEVTEPEVLLVEAGGDVLGAPALALGSERGDGRLLALAYQAGCAPDSRVMVELHELALDGDGALTATAHAPAVEVGDARAERDPVLAHSAARDAWVVAYQDGQGLRARLLEADGALRGSEPYLLVENASDDSVRALLQPGALSLDDDGWFGVAAPVKREGESPERAVELHALACE